MALEPAIGILLGLLVLHQQPSPAQLAGILLDCPRRHRRPARRPALPTRRRTRRRVGSELDLIGEPWAKR